MIILFSHIDATGSGQNWCSTPFKCIRFRLQLYLSDLAVFELTSSFRAVLLVFNEFRVCRAHAQMAGCTPYFRRLRIPKALHAQ